MAEEHADFLALAEATPLAERAKTIEDDEDGDFG
jgi:hypothetical protein